MAYTKHTWVTGETITAANLNHLEDGVVAVSANGAIGTANLADGAVTTAKLAVNAVTSAKIANNSITEDELADGAVVTAKIEDGAVTSAKIATAAVSGTQIADETITATNIADETLTEAKLDPTFAASLAKVDGSYTDMTVGLADQLQSNVGIEDKVPYNFRTSGGSVDIGDKERVDSIVGGTVAWNQLCNGSSVTVPNGHKYIAYIGGSWSVGTSNGTALSTDASTDKVFDITQMYGSTIANYVASLTSAQEIAWFCGLYPNAKNAAYDAGSLLSVKTSAHKMVGFNQWNEEWESGTYLNTTGAKYASARKIRNKNPIRVLPNTAYYWHVGTTSTDEDSIFYYREDMSFIGRKSFSHGDTINGTFTTPADCYYINFAIKNTTYSNDICINLHWDGERDGEYEAYQSWNYPLDSDLELRGIPRLDANNKLYYDGDTYAPDGTVTRKWTELTNQSGAIGDTITLTGLDTSATDIITSEGHLADVGTLSGTTLTLTKALSGASIVYPLATPSTEAADPYQQTQNVSDWGTEEYVDSRTVPIPVGHNTFYQANLKAKLEMAPNSPSGDGDYVVRQTSGENVYVPLEDVKELPDFPTTDGNWSLRCTVVGGVATLSWVSA